MVDVTGFGASSVDRVFVLPEWPRPSGPAARLPIADHFLACGGQTATALAGCAALGLRAAFAGVTGDDAAGAMARAELEARGVDLSQATVAGTQAYSVILLAAGQPDRIVLWSGGSARPRALDTTAFRLLHVDDVYLDEALAAARTARDAGRLVTTDIDHVTGGTLDLVRAATHPVMAEHVPSLVTGEADLERALRAMRAHTAAPLVVTLGARGAVALDGDALIAAPGCTVNAVDTTGAGDVFRAGFIAALLEGRDLAGTLRFANAAAAASCETRGAIAGVPTRDRVLDVLGA